MFNSNKIIVIAGLLSLFTLVACKKGILDTVPQTSISDLTAFSTPEKILGQVNNLYKSIQSANFYGGRLLLINEQRGEEFTQNDPNPTTGAAVWGQNVLSSNEFVNVLWTAAYKGINNVNIFISNIENTSVIGSPLKEQYLAEAKFVRALSYLALIQIYAQPFIKDNGASPGLPLRLKAELSADNNNLARSSVAKVYEQIISDLDDAERDLPADQGSAALNSSRAHKATAIALKTRTYLIKGQFNKVVEESRKLVPAQAPFQYSSGSITHKLESNVTAAFGSSYTGPESIFSLPYNNIDAPSSYSLANYYYGAIINALHPDGIAANPVFSRVSVDARKSLVHEKNNQQVLAKYTKIVAPFTDYVKVIRYAEVLLNYAEAAAETNDLETAAKLLEAVRYRSDAGYKFTTEEVSAKNVLIATILKERRIELLGEGFRAPDLQRRLQTLPGKSGAAGTAPAILPSASNYIWPIPSDETSTNTIIEAH